MVNLTDGPFINPERKSTLFKDSLSTFGIEFLQTENSRLWVLNIKYLSLFSLESLDVRSFRSRDEQEVAGYANAMQLIHDSYNEIDLSENNIKYLHKVMMRFSEKDNWHLGEYKKHPNHVAAFDSQGNQIGIIFETATALDTPRRMELLVGATQERFHDEDIHPLLTIADFVVRFLAIHPFQDGNGRLSRILTNLLMLRNGYTFTEYSSHERIVEANKENYYLALREAQEKLKSLKEFSLTWLEFFLKLLKKKRMS